MAWCLKNESVNCLLLGATTVEQFKENIHALQVFITQLVAEMFLIRGAYHVNISLLADSSAADPGGYDRD